MDVKNLKLIARTEDDLRVVSAHLQDSIANLSDVANLQKNRIFLMQLNIKLISNVNLLVNQGKIIWQLLQSQ